MGTGSTLAFFRDAKLPNYKTMFTTMQKDNDSGAGVFVQSNSLGVQKVLVGISHV